MKTNVNVIIKLLSIVCFVLANIQLSYSQWTDDFETYTASTWPAVWFADANATDLATNYIDISTYSSGSKSLRLYGDVASCWGAITYKPVALDKPFEIEVDVRNGNETLSGCHPDRAYIGLRKGTNWNNPYRILVKFKGNGKIESSGYMVDLGTYTTLTWYRVRIKYERISSSSVLISYWINGVYKGKEVIASIAEEDELTNLDLDAAEGTVWFDNVSVSASTPEPVCETKNCYSLFTSSAPDIDGIQDEVWSITDYTPVLTNHEETPDNASDFDVKYKSLWDNNYLYILAEVTDENKVYAESWHGDNVELFFDQGNERSGVYDENDIQLRFNWNSTAIGAWPEDHFAGNGIDDIVFMQHDHDAGYVFEMRFPWTIFKDISSIEPGCKIGFDISAGDNDGSGERESIVTWNSDDLTTWQNSQKFGTLNLAKYSDTCICIDTVHIQEYDTTKITVYDTIKITVYDTVTITNYDTVTITSYDTVSVTVNDTIYQTVYDTVYFGNMSGIAFHPLSESEVSCYPNPTEGVISLSNSGTGTINNIRIYSITGEFIKACSLNKSSSIDLGLTQGKYFLTLTITKEGQDYHYVEKLIVL